METTGEKGQTENIMISYIHSNDSWCKRCSPDDTFHRWAGRCPPVCHLLQSGNQHQWKTPADELRSSSRFAPGKKKQFINISLTQKTLSFFHTVKLVAPSYLADRHLHNGIEAPLWRVQVSWDLLLTDQLIELLSVVCQIQDVLIAEGACAVLVPCAGVDEPGRCGADVRHYCLLHKGAKA